MTVWLLCLRLHRAIRRSRLSHAAWPIHIAGSARRAFGIERLQEIDIARSFF
jgi:hypothetical protein